MNHIVYVPYFDVFIQTFFLTDLLFNVAISAIINVFVGN